MPIEVQTHSRKWFRLVNRPHATTKQVLRCAFMELGVVDHSTNISVVLADDKLLWDLNKEYRKKDKPTNVLSFNYELGLPGCCGEIFLSIDTIVFEANELGIDTTAHFTHMLVHGFLHIMGYTHNEAEDKALMQKMERNLLSLFGIADPYSAA